jgi:hypothetical protein
MTLADVTNRLNEVSERYEIPERVSVATQKVREGVHAAGDAAYRGAYSAYEFARAHPRSTIGGAIAAAMIIGGVLYYLFGDKRHTPVQRRKAPSRVRAGAERRRKHRTTARASA